MDVARIRSSTPLLYDDGPDPTLDRPAHVRAGSGLCWAPTAGGQRLCICQDDAHFAALVDPRLGHVTSLALPAGALGLRQFDKGRSNKMDKMDLEAACLVATPRGERVWLVGSGSAGVREVLVELDTRTGEVTAISTAPLCAALRAHPLLAGAELNLEGACVRGSDLVLLQRGNGIGGKNGVVRVPLEDVHALWAPDAGDRQGAVRVDLMPLPALQDVPLTFTDASPARHPARVLFLAAAEASPNAIDDGEVEGAALGVLDVAAAPALLTWAPLLERDGRLSKRKPEGVVLDPLRPGIAFVVVDMDDPQAPSELLEVELPPALMRALAA